MREDQQERARLIEQCRTILREAENRRRALTDEEKARYQRNLDEARSLALDIAERVYESELARAGMGKRMVGIRGFTRADAGPGRNHDVTNLVGITL